MGRQIAQSNISTENQATKIRYLDKAVIIYTGLFIIYQSVNLLTPFHELFGQPGWSIVPKLIGLAGGALLAMDLLTARTVLRSAHVKWVVLLLLALTVASAVRHQYNSAFEFAKYIIYVFTQDLLVLSTGLRMTGEERQSFLKWLHAAVSAVFIPALCYMLWQFLTQQHYLNYDYVDQGWFDGRLYGIMYILYDGAFCVAILAAGTLYLLVRSRKAAMKILYSAELLICVIYVALSGCRTAYAACAAGAGFVILHRFFRSRHADRRQALKAWAGFILTHMAALIILYAGITGIRAGGMYLAWNIDKSQHASAETFSDSKESMDRHGQYTVSSGRVDIWKTYLGIMADKPSHLVFGLSYNGYSQYIRENYPDSFIITYFKEHYPESYAKGNVYVPHNSYLFVLVTAGVPGLLAVLAFLLLCAADVIRNLFSGRMTSFEGLLAAMVLMTLTAGVFEDKTIIPVSAVAGFFWMTAGFLMTSLRHDPDKDQADAERSACDA